MGSVEGVGPEEQGPYRKERRESANFAAGFLLGAAVGAIIFLVMAYAIVVWVWL